jgi:hypothetical protein
LTGTSTSRLTRRQALRAAAVLGGGALLGVGYLSTRNGQGPVTTPRPRPPLVASDHGVVLEHGDGPGGCDVHGARDVIVWPFEDTLYMHYDGAGADGWRLCLATSSDGVQWTKHGAVLPLGPPGSRDAASASYGVPFFDGSRWHLFYVGTEHATPPPERVPAVPYYTMKADAPSPSGPWTKRPDVVPFSPQPGTYYASSASPGSIVERDGEYLQFFSASAGEPLQRTLGIARTTDLDGAWTVDPEPILPPTEQIENSALYFEPTNGTWFLFTNHVDAATSRTDAVWVYWTTDLTSWDPARRATALDTSTSTWSHGVVGLPGILGVGGRLALYYDGVAGDGRGHTGRDIGLAWLPLPLTAPQA